MFYEKFSPATKACFMGVGLAEKCNKITWNNNVLPLQAPFPIQYNTTIVLPTILIEPTVPATSYNYVTVQSWDNQKTVCAFLLKQEKDLTCKSQQILFKALLVTQHQSICCKCEKWVLSKFIPGKMQLH